MERNDRFLSSDALKEATNLLHNSSSTLDTGHIVAKPRAPPPRLSKRMFILNMSLMMMINIVSDGARGIIVPTQFTYVNLLGGTMGTNGLIFGVFVLGRLISSFVLGYVADRRPGREIFIFTSLVATLGHILYAIARLPTFGANGLWVAFVGRFLVGFATGSIACVRAIIVSVVPKKQHTRYLSWSLAAQFIGYALSPGLCAPFALVSGTIGELEVDVLNLGSLLFGLINFLVGLVSLIFMPTITPKPKEMGQKRCSIGVAIYLYLFFVIRGVVAFIETVGGAEYAMLMGLSNSIKDALSIALYFIYLGIAGLIAYFCIDFLSRRIKLYYILIVSFLFIVAGALLMAQYPSTNSAFYLFTIGAVFVWSIGGPGAQVVILALYSDMLGDGPKGAMLGWAATIGSVGSILVRAVSGYLDLFYVYVVCSALSLLSVFLLAYFHSSPAEIRRERQKALLMARS